MRIDTRIAKNLGGYFQCVDEIALRLKKDDRHPPVLWFRGAGDMNHSLIPSLFRANTRAKRSVPGRKKDYSQLHYAEDIRTQHYIAKNYHFFQNEPSSRVEWLEVMQHHGVKTRVLDWSESSTHSLLFAVEPFLDEGKARARTAGLSVPCVWVLEPAALNKQIFQNIRDSSTSPVASDNEKILGLFDIFQYDSLEKQTVLQNIQDVSDFSSYAETEETAHIDYILNLSEINDEIRRDGMRIRQLLLDGDIMNPYYYILSRIYSDGHMLENRVLPPLAVVQPYHSERIKAQHGVFTVFPFYEEKSWDHMYRKMGINPDAMENNAMASQVLHQIIIENPQKMAFELMQNGMNDSWLYPEMPVVSNEIENHAVYC